MEGVALLALYRRLKPILPYLVAAVALLGFWLTLVHVLERRGFHKRDAEVAGLNGTIANMKAASAKAAADNIAHVQAVEARDAEITKDQTNALSIQLVDAHAAVAGYVQRLRDAQAHPGNAGDSRLPQAPVPAAAVAGANQGAVVPVGDLDICAEAVVKAQGWQAWWAKVSVEPR